MLDPKTKLPNGGGMNIEYSEKGKGAPKITNSMTGTYKAGKVDAHYCKKLSKDFFYVGEMVDGKFDGIGKLSSADCRVFY